VKVNITGCYWSALEVYGDFAKVAGAKDYS